MAKKMEFLVVIDARVLNGHAKMITALSRVEIYIHAEEYGGTPATHRLSLPLRNSLLDHLG